MSKVLDIAKEIIACPSVTPEDAGAQEYLSAYFEKLGFDCHPLEFNGVPNLFARLGDKGPHFCYAGHTDVVPPGPENEWTFGPFNPTVKDGILYGRGASDMKGSVAAMAAAAAIYIEKHGAPKGSVSFLITGDEEGPAVDGTVKVLEWMDKNNHLPDVCLVGEPSNPSRLGEEIKIGRRGSFTGALTVRGTQGHVAYPHRADNPLPRLVKLLDALADYKFDEGTEFFPPSNLELVAINVDNKVDNVIPGAGSARFNIRFNDKWTSETLEKKVRDILDAQGVKYTLETTCGAESFITKPGEWSNIVRAAVHEMTGREAQFTTNGGTSDARFIQRYCPVVEFGLTNESVHRVDEFLRVEELDLLTDIYVRILEKFFNA